MNNSDYIDDILRTIIRNLTASECYDMFYEDDDINPDFDEILSEKFKPYVIN